MTKVLEDGQFEWIFEELDFNGALEIVLEECKTIQSLLDEDCLSEHAYLSERAYNSFNRKLNKLIKVALYLDRLKKGVELLMVFELPKDGRITIRLTDEMQKDVNLVAEYFEESGIDTDNSKLMRYLLTKGLEKLRLEGKIK